jgi:hypothetical protein
MGAAQGIQPILRGYALKYNDDINKTISSVEWTAVARPESGIRRSQSFPRGQGGWCN